MCGMMASYAGGYYVNVQTTVVSYSNVNPEEAEPAVDGDLDTSWTLRDDQTTGSFTAEFDEPHTVSYTIHSINDNYHY